MTSTPTISATTIVRVRNTSPLFGSVKPTASKSLNNPVAIANPRNSPTTDATKPVTNASSTTVPRSCRREAPSVRRVANSRVRWAIVIDSEFAITNEPTNRAIPPNTSRNVCRKLRKLDVPAASSLACSSAVRTCVASGKICRTASSSCCSLVPDLVAIRIWSSLPVLSNNRCAVPRSNPASVAPPIDDTAPNSTSPEIFICTAAPRAWTPIVSPVANPFSLAVFVSITTWSPLGQAPETRVSELNCGSVGSTLKPRFGAPPKTIDLPSLPISCASPLTEPPAAPTSGSARTFVSRPASNGGAVTVPSWDASNAFLPVIAASVFL